MRLLTLRISTFDGGIVGADGIPWWSPSQALATNYSVCVCVTAYVAYTDVIDRMWVIGPASTKYVSSRLDKYSRDLQTHVQLVDIVDVTRQ